MIAFLAQSDQSQFMGLLLPIIVITLSMGIPIVAIITEHLQKQQKMRLMEKAIEHGADPGALEVQEKSGPRLPYRSGMVCLAIGVALVAGDRFIDIGLVGFHLPLVVGGLITGAVGIALLMVPLSSTGKVAVLWL